MDYCKKCQHWKNPDMPCDWDYMYNDDEDVWMCCDWFPKEEGE